jgi:hypothetical protein
MRLIDYLANNPKLGVFTSELIIEGKRARVAYFHQDGDVEIYDSINIPNEDIKIISAQQILIHVLDKKLFDIKMGQYSFLNDNNEVEVFTILNEEDE